MWDVQFRMWSIQIASVDVFLIEFQLLSPEDPVHRYPTHRGRFFPHKSLVSVFPKTSVFDSCSSKTLFFTLLIRLLSRGDFDKGAKVFGRRA